MNGPTVLDPDHHLDDHEHGATGTGNDMGATTAGPGRGLVVRRNGALAAAVGGLASAVAIAYLARATGSGAWLDWVLCAVLGVLGVVHLLALLDSRAPLLVADDHGVRIRQGRAWHGMTWDSLLSVEHLPRRGVLRDGRLDVVAAGPGGAEQVLSVRLSMATTVVSDDPDLTTVLLDLTRGSTEVVELDPALPAEEDAEHEGVTAPDEEPAAEQPPEVPTDEPADEPADDPAGDVAGDAGAPAGSRFADPRPALARGIGAVAARLQRRPAHDLGDLGAPGTTVPEPAASATPSPLRVPVTAVRTESVRDHAAEATLGATALDLGAVSRGGDPLPEVRELRRPGSVDLVEETVAWEQRAGAPPSPVLIDGFSLEAPVRPAVDPVVGPVLAVARTRIGLTVDQLAERTRIRPHVIESIEVDDFVPCGGDFYARGHLRTLARVLGVDAGPLLASYDERYADAPIDPRRVFEAELATGSSGSIRGTRGGHNWSVLVAAVMALVLAWSVARLVMDSPVDLNRDALVLNGSRGIDNGATGVAEPVAVLLTAAGGGTHVEVRDGSGEIVFAGDLAFGESRELTVSPPVRVQSSDGSLEVGVAGAEPEAVGEAGQPATDTFIAPAD